MIIKYDHLGYNSGSKVLLFRTIFTLTIVLFFFNLAQAQTFNDIGAGLINVASGSAAWGDYDNDGDLDILLTGLDITQKAISRVYRNDNGSFTDINANLENIWVGSAAWGDFDNDGDLDILLAGKNNDFADFTAIYRNDNGTFTDIGANLAGADYGSVVWADYDNDGDLDLLVVALKASDNSWHVKVFRNNTVNRNSVPSTPGGLSAQVNGDQVTLDWSPAGDSETLQRTLTYNVRIGTSPGLSNILNPMAIESTGLRKIAQMGNAYHNTDWTYNLDPVTRYYWSVQTIDQAFAGSPFAAEQNFMTGLGVGIEENTAPELPEKFLLHQNYPNPFNPVTLIRYSVPVASQVTLKVYDTLGKEIITLVNQQHTRGYYDIVFSGEDLESGVYLVRMTADGYTGTQKMVLIK